MKFYSPSFGETIEDARKLPKNVWSDGCDDPGDYAELAAEYLWDDTDDDTHRDLFEKVFLIVVVENGALWEYNIEVDFLPTFYAEEGK